MRLTWQSAQFAQSAAMSAVRRTSPRGRAVFPLALIAGLLALLALVPGCTRRWFRLDADHEVASVLDEKDNYAEWELRDYNVYPDTRARFFDPANPDRPPMPPDDPAAWLLSPHPQKPWEIASFEGTGYLALLEQWDSLNRTRLNEKQKEKLVAAVTSLRLGRPAMRDGGDGIATVSLRNVERMGDIRTAEFAKSDEAIPVLRAPKKELSPLVVPVVKQDVTNAKPQAVEEILPPPREVVAPSIPKLNGARKEPYLIDLEQSIELAVINSREFQNRREDLYLAALPVTLERFAFAPQFAATYDAVRTKAGSEVPGGPVNDWSLTGDLQMSKLFSTGALLVAQLANTTVVNLTGTGKHTISESELILDLSQPFLRGGGRGVTLEGLTQAERDLVYELREYAHFHREFFVSIAAGGGISTVNGTPAIGYYPTLVRQAALRNELRNQSKLSQLRIQYKHLATDPLPAGGRGGIAPLQVDTVEQQQRRSESDILELRSRYEDSQDQFKGQLGLPTDFPLEIDNTILDPIYVQIEAYEGMINTSRTVVRELAKVNAQEVSGAQLRDLLRRIIGATGYFRPARERWERDRASYTPQRLQESKSEIERLTKQVDELDQQNLPIPAELEDKLNSLKLDVDLAALDEAVRSYEQEPWRREVNPEAIRKARIEALDKVMLAASNAITQVKKAHLDKIGREESWPTLPPLLLNGTDLLALARSDDAEKPLQAQNLVGQTALVNRLDLMNQRAQLVDSWRDLAVSANSLLGVFDARYHMDVATPAGLAQPLDFAGKRSRHQLFLNTELPLTRKLERNNYRASLIEYQRQRRRLMGSEDLILFQVRQNLRLLHQLAEQYRIRQREVDLAHRQVDNALEAVEQATGDPAAQTSQLLNAIGSVPRAENSLIGAYVDYVTNRMEFYRDLELLRVDSRGVWIDEYNTAVQAPIHQSRP